MLLQEHHALLFVDLRGAQRWRREWTEEVEVVVPLDGGIVAVVDSSDRLSLLALKNGRLKSELKLPQGATAGIKLPGGGASFNRRNVAFLSDGELTESESRSTGERVEAVVRDLKGRFWLQGSTSWSVLDAKGKLLLGWELEGEEGNHSFPPAFLGGRAWFFQKSTEPAPLLLERS